MREGHYKRQHQQSALQESHSGEVVAGYRGSSAPHSASVMRANDEPDAGEEQQDLPAEIRQLLVDALESHVCVWMCASVSG